jgi:hypothetical protein
MRQYSDGGGGFPHLGDPALGPGLLPGSLTRVARASRPLGHYSQGTLHVALGGPVVEDRFPSVDQRSAAFPIDQTDINVSYDATGQHQNALVSH